ncbi:MAG: hypothetical protein NVS3B24_14750 [Candidatus Dormibacteria bacterium]
MRVHVGPAEAVISYSGGVVRVLIAVLARRRRARSGALLAVAVALTACGPAAIKAPTGPGASATPDAATAVMRRACSTVPRSDAQARDVTFIQSSLLRQESQLQRVADDLSGAVPGGNLGTDTQLPQANAKDLVSLVEQSTLCSPYKEKLLAAARDLATADDALARAAGGGDVGGAVQSAQAMLRSLRAITENPPPP